VCSNGFSRALGAKYPVSVQNQIFEAKNDVVTSENPNFSNEALSKKIKEAILTNNNIKKSAGNNLLILRQ
jgi:hypothetical protein